MMAAGLEYAEAGVGPPVICLHGIGGGAESFRAQLAGLKGCRVIALNLPGYGASAPGPQPPGFDTLSRALGEFIAALGLGQVHLVGHSIGGMLALEHALRRPDQVASLVLIGTTPSFGGRDDRFRDEFLKARLAPLEAGQTMPEMARAAAPQIVGPQASAEVIEAVAAPMARVPETTWRGILQCLVTFNRRGDLGDVHQPVCLIAGGHDMNAPPRTMAKMADNLPKAEYHLIGPAGHMINQEAPAETNAIIGRFLRKHAI